MSSSLEPISKIFDPEKGSRIETSPGICPTVGRKIQRLWKRKFAPENAWEDLESALDGGRGNLTLPLVNTSSFDDLTGLAKQGRSLFTTKSLPNNCWMKAGDLLQEGSSRKLSESEQAFLYGGIAEEFCDQKSQILEFSWVHQNERWQLLMEELRRRSCYVQREVMFESAFIDINDSWDQYEKSLSKSHRKSIRKCWKNLEKSGKVEFVRSNQFQSKETLKQNLNQAFQIAHRGWKGDAGTSVLSHPGMIEFFTDVGWELALENQFELLLLKVDDRPIAFEVGYKAGRVFYSHKIGYDQKYKQFGPGQLLLHRQLEMWYQNQEIDYIDTMGIVSEATMKWKPRLVPVARYLVANHGPAKVWATAKGQLKPWVKKLLRR